uniref:Uncharacterized protein n=1 Tax=Ackermannviridae sp. TaxID=2831612 RepID=A0A8S5VPQ2_9CAUD|nr:MAG TPA: hypothetical protein [Ackermannviridae sp.]
MASSSAAAGGNRGGNGVEQVEPDGACRNRKPGTGCR